MIVVLIYMLIHTIIKVDIVVQHVHIQLLMVINIV